MNNRHMSRTNCAVVPYEEMIRWCRERSGYFIGDFGRGEAKPAEAVHDDVVACDMAHVPLDN